MNDVSRTTTVLARLRVPLGFACAVLVFWLAAPTGVTLAAGSIVAALGESIRIWAAGHLKKSREVTASGPYRWSAHPLYVGSAVMAAGLAVAAGQLSVGAIIAAYLVLTLGAAIRREEAFLRRTFGDRYDRYRVGDIDDHRRFSLALAMDNREYRAIVGLATAILLLALKASYNGVFWRAAGTRF